MAPGCQAERLPAAGFRGQSVMAGRVENQNPHPVSAKNAEKRVWHPLVERHEIEQCGGWKLFSDLFLGGREMERDDGRAFRSLDWRDFEGLGSWL